VRISAKGEYAIKAMVDLALHDGPELQPIQDIAARQSIPQRYLEQVLLQLKRSGFLYARRGSSGGYRLSRPPDQITVGALLRAVEGPSAAADGRARRAVAGDRLRGGRGGRPHLARGPAPARRRASQRGPPHVPHLTTPHPTPALPHRTCP